VERLLADPGTLAAAARLLLSPHGLWSGSSEATGMRQARSLGRRHMYSVPWRSASIYMSRYHHPAKQSVTSVLLSETTWPMEGADAQCLALPWGRSAVSGQVAHRLSAEEAGFQASGLQEIRPAQAGAGALDAAATLHSQKSERPEAARPEAGVGAADAAASLGR
jgi:hypothetical protein